jgi:hypothetical protein
MADLHLVETGPVRPTLRVRVASGWRLSIEASGRPLLLGRVQDAWQGLSLFYPRPSDSPQVLPPWSAADCRRLGDSPQAWFGEILRQLKRSDTSPLHAGEWLLSDRPEIGAQPIEKWIAEGLAELQPGPGGAGAGAWAEVSFRVPRDPICLIPLRQLSPVDAARVKAQRRQAREGVLAPIVVQFVSGLSGYIVLDGHDRLVAARAEGITPGFVALDRINSVGSRTVQGYVVARYVETMDHLDEAAKTSTDASGIVRARSRESRSLASGLAASRFAGTCAQPISVAEWESIAAQAEPSWLNW